MEAEKTKSTEVVEGEEGIDRKKHDLTLTEGAEKAIKALRGARDEVDGFARDRDVEGLEKARKRHGESGQLIHEGEEGTEEEGFCTKCFTPLLPDPEPEQLFIWLHAMRCKCLAFSERIDSSLTIFAFQSDTTIEWDWKSALPEWAESSYEVPLSSILT